MKEQEGTEQMPHIPKKAYEQFLDNIPDTVVVNAVDGTVFLWNKGAEKVFGYSKAEMVGENIEKIYPKDELAKMKQIREQVLEGKQVANVEILEARKEDGTRVPVLLSVIPLLDDDGAVCWIGGIGKDITELIRMQQKLIEAEKLETVHNMIVTLNHKMNQPLAVGSSTIQLASDDLKKGKPISLTSAELIYSQCRKINELLQRISKIQEVKTTEYIPGTKMVDID